MARRLGDPHVLLWALNAMSLGIWRPGSARVRLETNRETFRHELSVRYWPGGEEPVLLSEAHPHGAWIAWRGTPKS